MTPNMALEIITNAVQTDKMTVEQDKALSVAQKALEKQGAQKPIILKKYVNITLEDFVCPVCGKRIISKIKGEWISGRLQKYCDNCGQKLDWSDYAESGEQ